jgi:hypothetical protein
VLFPWGKGLEHEAHHLLSSGAEAKNGGDTSILHMYSWRDA